jgi:hypothetical protein
MSLLNEDNGNTSLTRLITLMIVSVALCTGIGLAIASKLDANGVALVLGELGLAITGKTVSKKLEA